MSKYALKSAHHTSHITISRQTLVEPLRYGITVDLLFTQSSDSNIPTGAPRWLSVAIPFVKARQAAGKPTPAFRFDVEYLPTSADAERVLKLAEVVRTTVDSAWPDASQRPLISWYGLQCTLCCGIRHPKGAPLLTQHTHTHTYISSRAVNTAAAMNLDTSQVTCPVSGKAALIAECFFEIVDSLTVMDYRSFAVQEPSPKTACDGMAIRGGPFFTMAAAAGKRVSLAAETSCDLGSKYQVRQQLRLPPLHHAPCLPVSTSIIIPLLQFKISYCAKGQLYHTNEPLEYMYTALNDTRNALEDTSATLKQYPCAGQQEAPVVSLKPNQVRSALSAWHGKRIAHALYALCCLCTVIQHLWNQQTVASPNMVIEDAHAWETLAYGTTTITDNCPYQDFSWQSCM